MGTERVRQVSSVADERRARTVGQEQGLVRIERNAVGPLDTADESSPFVAQGEKAAVSAVDVKPGAKFPAKLGDLRQRIDRSRVDRARRGDDQPGLDAGAAVLFQRLLKRLDRHSIAFVRIDPSAR